MFLVGTCCCDGVVALPPQACVGAFLEANERYATSTKAYRETTAGNVYGNHLKTICGPDGLSGRFPFTVKKRAPSAGGDWTMAKSIELRPQVTGAIYAQAEKCVREISNQINPVWVKLFPEGKLPSGTNEADAILLLEFYLQYIVEAKSKCKAKAKEEEASLEAQGEVVVGEAVHAQAVDVEAAPEPEVEVEVVKPKGDGAEDEEEELVAIPDLDMDVKRVAKLDPWGFTGKNPNMPAWLFYSYLGKQEAGVMKQPVRKTDGGSGRAAQRERADKRASVRRGAAAAGAAPTDRLTD